MNTRLCIITLEQLNKLLCYHPYFRDRKSFAKQYWHAQCYLLLKQAQHTNTLPSTSTHHLATPLGISHIVVNYWLRNERIPRLLQSLTTHEHARQLHETTLPSEHHLYRIDPSTVYEAVRPLKDRPHTPELLAKTIETLYHKVETKRFLIADLKPYHEAGPRWTRTIAQSIRKQRNEVETLLNQHIPLDDQPHTRIRVGIHNHTLYLYHHRTNPNDWLTLLNHEYFYFDTIETKCYFMDQVRRYLNTTDPGLSSLIQQLTDHPGTPQHPKSILSDISRLRPYFVGASLNFLLDASGLDFDQIHLFITRLGRDTQGDGRGGIYNPIFIKNEERDTFRARLTAIALSDGHIHHETKQFTYIEKDPERRNYVWNLMKQLGDVYITEEQTPGAYRLNMPVVVGRLLESWEIPSGDKHLSPKYRLPEIIRNGQDQVKCAYLAEVIPEDGYFHTHGRAIFGIKRAQILNAGPKAENYKFKPKISRELQKFIKQNGEKRIHQIRNEPPREETVLVWGRIKKLEKSTNSEVSNTAKQLRETIEQNPCQLLEDEIAILKTLKISMSKKPKEIHLQPSGRISMVWETYTTKEKDAQRFAQIALPSSNPKRRSVENWLAQTNK